MDILTSRILFVWSKQLLVISCNVIIDMFTPIWQLNEVIVWKRFSCLFILRVDYLMKCRFFKPQFYSSKYVVRSNCTSIHTTKSNEPIISKTLLIFRYVDTSKYLGECLDCINFPIDKCVTAYLVYRLHNASDSGEIAHWPKYRTLLPNSVLVSACSALPMLPLWILCWRAFLLKVTWSKQIVSSRNLQIRGSFLTIEDGNIKHSVRLYNRVTFKIKDQEFH